LRLHPIGIHDQLSAGTQSSKHYVHYQLLSACFNSVEPFP